MCQEQTVDRQKAPQAEQQRMSAAKFLFDEFLKSCLVNNGNKKFLKIGDTLLTFNFESIDLDTLADQEYKNKGQIKSKIEGKKDGHELLEYAMWFLDLIGADRHFYREYSYNLTPEVSCDKGTGIGSSRMVYSGTNTSPYLDVLRVWKYIIDKKKNTGVDAIKSGIITFLNGDEGSNIQDPIKNAFRFLCAPDFYEPIFSTSQKKNIISAFYNDNFLGNSKIKNKDLKNYPTDDTINQGAPNEDKKLHIIRTVLERQKSDDKVGYGLEKGFSFWDEGIVEVWNEHNNLNDMSEAQLLEYKRAMVLYGPPGTGKTHDAKDLAYKLIARYYIKNEKDEIENVLSPNNKKWKDELMKKYVRRLQMHVNYSYDDFIAGTALGTRGRSGMRSTVKKGFLLNFLDEIKADKSDHPYILILDEINRTDISRVFGELFSAMEYREGSGEPVRTAIGNFELVVPKNLYIIGTMNEIDFSLEHIDFALRRRFVWMLKGFNEQSLQDIILYKCEDKDIKDKVKPIKEKLDEYIDCCKKLNDEITKKESLGKSYQIGHTFFAEIVPIYAQVTKSDGGRDKFSKAKNILWQISIKPTLDAYCGSMSKGEQDEFIEKCKNLFMNGKEEKDK